MELRRYWEKKVQDRRTSQHYREQENKREADRGPDDTRMAGKRA